jgi:putative chitinase
MTHDEFRQAAALSEKFAERWYGPLCAAMESYEINTPTRIAAFIAQTGHETQGLIHTQELWGPTPAQKGYEPPGRKAAMLGNTQMGDGYRFRGRGLIQITGRANYQACGKALTVDLLINPDLLANELAARSAAWWWLAHGCNAIADGGDFEALTKRINGGLNGIDDRLRRWEIAKSHLARK